MGNSGKKNIKLNTIICCIFILWIVMGFKFLMFSVVLLVCLIDKHKFKVC